MKAFKNSLGYSSPLIALYFSLNITERVVKALSEYLNSTGTTDLATFILIEQIGIRSLLEAKFNVWTVKLYFFRSCAYGRLSNMFFIPS